MRKGILLAAFGAGNRQAQSTLELFDHKVRGMFPGVNVRWAFTSELMRDRLAARRMKTDSVRKALEKMWFEKYTHVAVQSLHLIPGVEYTELLEDIGEIQRGPTAFQELCTGKPLLFSDNDVERAARALVRHLPEERTESEAVVFMGHGSQHESDFRYAELGAAVTAVDPYIWIGTMDGSRNIDHILPEMHFSGVQKVWLMPLLSVIGRHAMQDMGGDDQSSWKSRIFAAGMDCVPVFKGTVEYSGFADIWIAHLKEAMQQFEA